MQHLDDSSVARKGHVLGNKTLGDRLRNLRDAKKLTQPVAAPLIGVGFSTLQQHETGKSPSRSFLKKYASFYGVNADWLLTGLGEKRPGEKPHPAPLYNKGVPQQARDNDGLYGKTEHVESNGVKLAVTTHEPRGHSHQMAPIKAVESLTTILQSGNSTIVRAILSNLEAFGSAIEQETRDKARIAALEEECRDLRSRVTDLEQKMSLILEAQEQKKTASTNA